MDRNSSPLHTLETTEGPGFRLRCLSCGGYGAWHCSTDYDGVKTRNARARQGMTAIKREGKKVSPRKERSWKCSGHDCLVVNGFRTRLSWCVPNRSTAAAEKMIAGCRAWVAWYRVQGLRFWVWGSGFQAEALGCRVSSLGCIQSVGVFGVWVSGCRAQQAWAS